MEKKRKTPKKATFDQLALSLAKYVEECGGKAIVIGGIQIEVHGKHRYTMGIQFTGSFPKQ